MIALALVLACTPDPEFVTLSGTVFGDELSDGAPLGGAEVHTMALTGLEVDRVFADDSGYFEAQIPSGAAFFLGIEGDGHLPTGFAGQSAGADYAASDGLIWARSDTAMDLIQSDFAGCEPNDADGGTIEGWVGIGLDNGESIDAYKVTTAWVNAYDADAVPYETCYLADDEEAPQHDPAADQTGEHGRFLVQGSPTGLLTLEAAYWIDEGSQWAMDPLYYVIYVPEGGVASFQPLWVPALQQ